VLQRADVERRAPPLAAALDEAKSKGSSTISDPSNVQATWSYLDEVRGRESRTPTTVNVDDDYYEIVGISW